MKKLVQRVICLMALGSLFLVATGCHTAKGFGEDVEDAGEAIQDKTD